MNQLNRLVGRAERQKISMPYWLERIASAGIVSRDPQVVRRQRFTNIVTLVAAANAACYLVINILYGLYVLWPIHIYSTLFVVVAAFIPRLHRVGDNTAAAVLLPLVIAGTLFSIWMLGRDSQLQIYFTLAGVVVLMFGVDHWRQYVPWLIAFGLALLAAIHLAPPHGLLIPHDPRLRELLAGQAMVNAIIINGVAIYYALAALRRAELELQDQYARSAALVNTVLPAGIAARLTLGHETRIADRVENVSILFADLVGFTQASHDLPPAAVVDYLDDFVGAFDELCEKHGVEKIKSIGDSYMVVAGLNGDQERKAVALGRLALAMLDVQARRPPLGEMRLGLRIGIHIGSATAGIIGGTRFSYDVWGDAVNMASRMESQGVPGRIHVSEAYRRAVGDHFRFEARGNTKIKGIGTVRTCFLLAER